MMTREDEKWQTLLARSASTFSEERTLPFGFATATLARLRSEGRQQEEMERIGWRALLASMAALVLAASVTLTLSYHDSSNEFDPGVPSLVQMANIQVS
jgi:hypothetical protein